jgi:hypothetical protein
MSERIMKCYEVSNPTPTQFNFNYAVIRTRRVVECAFGRLKGRFPVLVNSRLQDDVFASDVAMVCCALHNLIEERWAAFDLSDMHITPAPRAVLSAGASDMRDKLAAYVHRALNVEPVTYTRRQYEGLLHGPVGFETL